MSNHILNIITHLEALQAQRIEAEKTQLMPKVYLVQEWQCKRLLATHVELWEQPRFKPAMQFFIDELYGPKDFSQRDQDLATVLPKMAKLLPQKALLSLECASHLNSLSFQLDVGIAENLESDDVNRDSYAAAYRKCDNRPLRKKQIEYIETLGADLSEVVKVKGISTLLMLSKKPAKIAGLLSLHQFLEHGYKAFKKLGDVDDFIHPIVETEKQIMDILFSDANQNPLPKEL